MEKNKWGVVGSTQVPRSVITQSKRREAQREARASDYTKAVRAGGQAVSQGCSMQSCVTCLVAL